MPIELSRVVGVRFKPDDYRQLKEQAKARGVTVSRLIRDPALGLPPPQHRRGLVDLKLLNELSACGNNLNQQTRVLHQLKHRGLIPEITRLLAVLKDALRVLREVKRRVAEACS